MSHNCGIRVTKKLVANPHCNGCHNPTFPRHDDQYSVVEVMVSPPAANMATGLSLCASCATAFAARLHNVRFMEPT